MWTELLNGLMGSSADSMVSRAGMTGTPDGVGPLPEGMQDVPGLSSGNMMGLMGSGGGGGGNSQAAMQMGLEAGRRYQPMDQYANIQSLMSMAQPQQQQQQQAGQPYQNQYLMSLMGG